MLKGKSIIRLYNAKSGVLEGESENTNLVTNAVADIINGNDPLGLTKHVLGTGYGGYYTLGAVKMMSYMRPLATRAYGGVLLWDNTIAEDANVTMPPENVNEIGHAGTSYSGNCTFRGTYNGNESGAIEGGYRHVWDFGTDKANGTIKCLSLTSQHGGNYGYNSSVDESMKPFFSYAGCADDALAWSVSSHGISTHINNVAYSGTVDGPFMYFAKNSDGTFYGIKRSIADYTKVLKVTFPNPNAWTLSSEYIVSEGKDLITGINQYAYTYVCEGKIQEEYLESASRLVHKSYALTGELLNTVTVELPTPSEGYSQTRGDSLPFYFRNRYYYRSSSSLVADEDGALCSEYSICSPAGELIKTILLRGYIKTYNGNRYGMVPTMIAGEFNGKLMIIGEAAYSYSSDRTPHYYGFIDSDSNWTGGDKQYTSVTVQSSGYILPRFCGLPPAVTSFNAPFKYITYSAHQARIIIAHDWRYLGTINNLAEPVVKTSAQVMKITYELTET